MDTQVPYHTKITTRLHLIVLISWATFTTLLAQSFQPEVKGLDSKTFKPEVKGLSGRSAQPTVQGLNNNMQPNVQGLSSSQSSQQGSSGAISTSSSGTASSSGTGAGSEAMKSGASTGTSSSSRPDKFFTCSRCGIEGAQSQGYCLGNFGMLTNTNGEPLKHVRK
jgi:hypothetical protein